MTPLVQARTKSSIHAFIGSGSHALLLTGPSGSGKETVLRHIASLLGSSREENIIVLKPEKKSVIEIAQVRELRNQLKLKSDAVTSVIIPSAEYMQPPAQNALLKILEEPPERVYFLLGAATPTVILPTIKSRTVHIVLNTLSISEVSDYLASKGHSVDEVKSALLMADGRIGLATEILSGETTLTEAIAEAKQLLASKLPDKLKYMDKIAKDKQKVSDVLTGLERVLDVGLQMALKSGKSIDPWMEKLKSVEFAIECQKAQVTTKLLLTRLALHL